MKKFYNSPECELLALELEGSVCTTVSGGGFQSYDDLSSEDDEI